MPLDDASRTDLNLWASPEAKRNSAEVTETQEWGRLSFKSSASRSVEWYFECALLGYEKLRDVVQINPQRNGSVPILKGTRFTVSQTLAELARSSGANEVADNYDIDGAVIREMLDGLSLIFMRPLGK
jgi:uncharacterized protein (DUF433 family)